jgi:hypothetical protein
MQSVIVFSKSGRNNRRCDSTCHNAKGEDCNCICNGKNHGKGLEVAQRNARRIANQLTEITKKDESIKVRNNRTGKLVILED